MVELSSDYLTEGGIKIPLLGKISINGSFEHLGVPDAYRTGGPFGMTISWIPVLVRETVVPPPIITGEFNSGTLWKC